MDKLEVEGDRIWRLSLARNEAAKAMERLDDLIHLWPEEAKKIDLHSIHRRWEKVKDVAEWHAGKVRV